MGRKVVTAGEMGLSSRLPGPGDERARLRDEGPDRASKADILA